MINLDLSDIRMKWLRNKSLMAKTNTDDNNFLFHFVFRIMFINFADPK